MNKLLQEKYHMPLTSTQTKNLIAYAKTQSLRDETILMLILTVGLSTLEVSRLNIGDIRGSKLKHVLFIHERFKGKKNTIIELTDLQYSILKPYLDTRDSRKVFDPLFVSTSNHGKGERLTTRTVTDICKRALRAIGLDDRVYSGMSIKYTAEILWLFDDIRFFKPPLNPDSLKVTKWTQDIFRAKIV